jgi:hypothetical protein
MQNQLLSLNPMKKPTSKHIFKLKQHPHYMICFLVIIILIVVGTLMFTNIIYVNQHAVITNCRDCTNATNMFGTVKHFYTIDVMYGPYHSTIVNVMLKQEPKINESILIAYTPRSPNQAWIPWCQASVMGSFLLGGGGGFLLYTLSCIFIPDTQAVTNSAMMCIVT